MKAFLSRSPLTPRANLCRRSCEPGPGGFCFIHGGTNRLEQRSPIMGLQTRILWQEGHEEQSEVC